MKTLLRTWIKRVRHKPRDVLPNYPNIDRDINTTEQTKAGLEEATAHCQGILSHLPGLIFQLMLAPNGVLSFPFTSEGAKTVCDLDAQTLRVDIQHFLDCLDLENWNNFCAGLGKSAEQLTDWQWEGRIDTPKGSRWLHLIGSPYRRGDGAIIWDGVMLDVTTSKQSQIDVTQSRDQLRELSSFLQTVREEEKATVARDIHDELGSMLSALKMDAFWLEKKLANLDPTLHAKAVAMTALLDDSVRTVRRIVCELRPTILDDLGLPAALEWLGSVFREHSGAGFRIDLPATVPELEPRQALALFRIAQESLTNITRHAQASEVVINIGLQENCVVMEILDNGIGIAPDKIHQPSSRGIRGMYERARLLGGDIHIERQASHGSIVRAMLPLQLQRERTEK